MREELDELLVKKYPKIFRDRHGDMQSTLMCWGFEVGDGWFNIIDAMCSNIQRHIDCSRRNRSMDLRFNRALARAKKGDMNGLYRFHNYGKTNEWSDYAIKTAKESLAHGKERRVSEACRQVVAIQIKEKFGTLRFYYNGGDPWVDGITSMADSMSGRTCEVCGNVGKQNSRGWIRTLCKTHAEAAGIADDYEEEQDD